MNHSVCFIFSLPNSKILTFTASFICKFSCSFILSEMHEPCNPGSWTIVISIEIGGHIIIELFMVREIMETLGVSHINFLMQRAILAFTGGKLLQNNIIPVPRWTNWICWAIENVWPVYVFFFFFELWNQVTQNDVTLWVTNSTIVIEILLLSY